MIDYKPYARRIRAFLYDVFYSNPTHLNGFIKTIESVPDVEKITVNYSPFSIYVHFKSTNINQEEFKNTIYQHLTSSLCSLQDDVKNRCNMILRRCSYADADPEELYRCIMLNPSLYCDFNFISTPNTPVFCTIIL